MPDSVTSARLAAAVLSFSGAAGAWAHRPDDPVPPQQPGAHSWVKASDGKIRDDQLAEFVCNRIQAYGGQVKDVKIIASCCYGGGLLDDFQFEFGPDGSCPGIPWVGGSASECDGKAIAYSAQQLADNPELKLGSFWIHALTGSRSSIFNPAPGAIRDPTSNNVKDDLNRARDNDPARKRRLETPVTGSGNGGGNATWHSPGESHQAVIFSGASGGRHHNNVENTEEALKTVWPDGSHSIQPVEGGTIQDLLTAIDAACAALDPNTQLVLCFLGHGGWSAAPSQTEPGWTTLPYPVNPPQRIPARITERYIEGLRLSAEQGQPLNPLLRVSLADPIRSEDWTIHLNGVLLPLPAGTLSGELLLPVDWTTLVAGDNNIDFDAPGTPDGPMLLNDLELDSGTIEDALFAEFCPADYNEDGFVDGTDYDMFNNDFESPDPAQQGNADYNGDGFVDGIDYDQFNADFEAPCP